MTKYIGTSRPRPFEERFFEKIVKDAATGCWNWIAAKLKRGYGVMAPGDGTSRAILVHRAAFERWVRPLQSGECVLHSCDNPSCCNPDHLHAGTIQQNQREMKARGRSTLGNRHPNRRLSEEMIPLIRDLVAGGVERKVVAAMCGVRTPTINAVIYGANWSQIGAAK